MDPSSSEDSSDFEVKAKARPVHGNEWWYRSGQAQHSFPQLNKEDAQKELL